MCCFSCDLHPCCAGAHTAWAVLMRAHHLKCALGICSAALCTQPCTQIYSCEHKRSMPHQSRFRFAETQPQQAACGVLMLACGLQTSACESSSCVPHCTVSRPATVLTDTKTQSAVEVTSFSDLVVRLILTDGTRPATNPELQV